MSTFQLYQTLRGKACAAKQALPDREPTRGHTLTARIRQASGVKNELAANGCTFQTYLASSREPTVEYYVSFRR